MASKIPQEANHFPGYAEAAVKLQRDWKVDTESLPFAKHIKGQALVSLVQKGLRYHHLSLTVDENGQQTKTLVPSMFFFGPESARPDTTSVQRESLLKEHDPRAVSPASTVATTAKSKGRENASVTADEPMPHPGKRGRKLVPSVTADRNGHSVRKVSAPTEPDGVNGNTLQPPDATSPSIGENVVEDAIMTNGNHEDKMDVDVDAAGSAEAADIAMEEQIEEALPPLVPTLSIGQSREIQVAPAKVLNLGPTSAILSLTTPQNIIRASWRPTDAATLIAQGETFCGVWNLTGRDLHPESVKPLPQSLFSSTNVGMVTATAWDPSGSLLAVATHSDQGDQIHLFDGQDLALVESLPASQRAVTMLKWHISGGRLFGIAPFGDESTESNTSSSTLLSWDLTQGSGAAAPETLQLPSTVFDFDCAQNVGSIGIFAAGENMVYRCRGSPLGIDQQWTSNSFGNREGWTFVRSARLQEAETLVVAAAAETASIWIPSRNILKGNAHNAHITGLDMRRQQPPNGVHHMIEFATSSEDGSVKIWHVNEEVSELTCSHQLRLEPSSPVMCLSYSPDGFCLVGGSYSHVRIWNAQHGYNLMGSWEGTEPEWRGSQVRDDDLASARSSVNDADPHAAYHSLAWHIDSKRLAFGLGSQMAVINFQR